MELNQPLAKKNLTTTRAGWAIVGGGLMGIRIAMRLAKHGQKVTLFESSSELGGLASSWEFGGIRWDRHYHVISLTDTRLLAFLDELELDQDIDWVETRTGFFTGGQLYSMSNSWEFLKFPPLKMIEKLRLGATIFAASKIRNGRKLESIPVEAWLRKWSGNGTFEKIWLPLLRAKLGENYSRVSAAFIWATIQRMYQARRSGVKKEMFGCVDGGYETILQRSKKILQKLGVDIHLKTPIQSIASRNGQVTVAVAENRKFEFEHAVLTTPATMVPRLCSQLNEQEIEQFNSIEYQGIVCGSVLLKKSLSPFYVTNITDSWVPLTGVIEMTRIVDSNKFGGKHLVYLPKYVTENDPWMQKSDAEIESRFRETLLKMYSHLLPEDIIAIRISRAGQVMALPVLNYSDRVPPIQLSLPNIFAVNSAQIRQGVLNVNETIVVAEQALEKYLLPAAQ